jgi:hypothetical protein
VAQESKQPSEPTAPIESRIGLRAAYCSADEALSARRTYRRCGRRTFVEPQSEIHSNRKFELVDLRVHPQLQKVGWADHRPRDTVAMSDRSLEIDAVYAIAFANVESSGPSHPSGTLL